MKWLLKRERCIRHHFTPDKIGKMSNKGNDDNEGHLAQDQEATKRNFFDDRDGKNISATIDAVHDVFSGQLCTCWVALARSLSNYLHGCQVALAIRLR